MSTATTLTPLHVKPEELRRAARRVADWRREHKLTQRDFATRAGVSVAAVQCLEAGTRRTRAQSLDRIAAALGVAPDQLLAPFAHEPAAPLVTVNFDRLLVDALLPDTLDVARMYQSADGELKAAIKTALRQYYAEQDRRATNGASADMVSGSYAAIARIRRASEKGA